MKRVLATLAALLVSLTAATAVAAPASARSLHGTGTWLTDKQGRVVIVHGLNDAQKSMGIISLGLLLTYPAESFTVPFWVKICCALAMGAGTMSGGWRIVRTLGSKMIKLQPIHGFAAETTASIIIAGASHLGIPVSTTQVISTSIMGVGATKRLSAVRWGIVGNIVWAWVLTLPLSFAFAGGMMWVYKLIAH